MRGCPRNSGRRGGLAIRVVVQMQLTTPYSSATAQAAALQAGQLFALRWNAGVHNCMTYVTGDIPVGATNRRT